MDEGRYSGTIEKCADCENIMIHFFLMHIQSNGWEVWDTEESKVVSKLLDWSARRFLAIKWDDKWFGS